MDEIFSSFSRFKAIASKLKNNSLVDNQHGLTGFNSGIYTAALLGIVDLYNYYKNLTNQHDTKVVISNFDASNLAGTNNYNSEKFRKALENTINRSSTVEDLKNNLQETFKGVLSEAKIDLFAESIDLIEANDSTSNQLQIKQFLELLGMKATDLQCREIMLEILNFYREEGDLALSTAFGGDEMGIIREFEDSPQEAYSDSVLKANYKDELDEDTKLFEQDRKSQTRTLAVLWALDLLDHPHSKYSYTPILNGLSSSQVSGELEGLKDSEVSLQKLQNLDKYMLQTKLIHGCLRQFCTYTSDKNIHYLFNTISNKYIQSTAKSIAIDDLEAKTLKSVHNVYEKYFRQSSKYADFRDDQTNINDEISKTNNRLKNYRKNLVTNIENLENFSDIDPISEDIIAAIQELDINSSELSDTEKHEIKEHLIEYFRQEAKQTQSIVFEAYHKKTQLQAPAISKLIDRENTESRYENLNELEQSQVQVELTKTLIKKHKLEPQKPKEEEIKLRAPTIDTLYQSPFKVNLARRKKLYPKYSDKPVTSAKMSAIDSLHKIGVFMQPTNINSRSLSASAAIPILKHTIAQLKKLKSSEPDIKTGWNELKLLNNHDTNPMLIGLTFKNLKGLNKLNQAFGNAFCAYMHNILIDSLEEIGMGHSSSSISSSASKFVFVLNPIFSSAESLNKQFLTQDQLNAKYKELINTINSKLEEFNQVKVSKFAELFGLNYEGPDITIGEVQHPVETENIKGIVLQNHVRALDENSDAARVYESIKASL